MRTSYLSLLAASLAQLASANECEPDNCARAITGTAYGSTALLQHSIDCSSFMSITVTPAGSTVTVTEVVTAPAVTETAATVTGVVTVVASTEISTVTEIVLTDTETTSLAIATVSVPLTSVVGTKTVTETATATYTTTCTPASGGSGGGWGSWGGWKRELASSAYAGVTIFPTSLPTYASVCSSSAKYVSACSCWGITKQTVTASVPVVTYTETSTATPTVSATADETSTVYETETSVLTVPATTTTIYTNDYTVTVPVTVPATAVTTIIVTKTATVSKTLATTSTTKTTKTTKTTSTTAATATCTPSVFGGRKKNCSCQVSCGYKYTPSQGSSKYSTCSKTSTSDCADACDLKSSCITFSFNKKTGICTLLDSLAGCTLEFDSSFSSGYFSGSC